MVEKCVGDHEGKRRRQPRSALTHARFRAGAILAGLGALAGLIALVGPAAAAASPTAAAVKMAPMTATAPTRPGRVSRATHVIGRGTRASCTSAAVVAAVRRGGIIRFSCGRRPVTIVMRQTAKVKNTSARVVLDGGGRVTLSGGGRHRILYMNTCDRAQVWITTHCDNQAEPQLIVENLTFKNGNSTGQDLDTGGGGAIFAFGGRLQIINSKFVHNRCDPYGPDVGGGAVRAIDGYANLPVSVINSRFAGNWCSNGGALSGLSVSFAITHSRLTGNRAIGYGANPARRGTPGGGSGGAIYDDCNTNTMSIYASTLTGNHAREGGGAVFFVSDNRAGTLTISHSVLKHNRNDVFATPGLPGIYFLGARRPRIIHSVLG